MEASGTKHWNGGFRGKCGWNSLPWCNGVQRNGVVLARSGRTLAGKDSCDRAADVFEAGGAKSGRAKLSPSTALQPATKIFKENWDIVAFQHRSGHSSMAQCIS